MPRKKKSAEVVVEEKKITLEEAKALWNDKLNDYFNNLMKGTLTTKEGYKVQFNDLDIMRLSNYLEMIDEYKQSEAYKKFSDIFSLDKGFLILADNTTVFDLDIDVIKSVRLQMMVRNNTYRSYKQLYRSIIEDATKPEDLDGMTFEKFDEVEQMSSMFDDAVKAVAEKKAKQSKKK